MMTTENSLGNANSSERGKLNYSSDLVSCYEKRNASLRRRHAALAEKVRLMELVLPSVLMETMDYLKKISTEANNKSAT